MEKYLVDTTVLIDHLRGNLSARNFLLNVKVAISLVSIAELIQGTRTKNQLSAIDAAVNDLIVFSINDNVATLALDLMKKFFHSHHLLFLDALIAATAINYNLTLITSNAKHFEMIKELNLKHWPLN